MDSLKVIRKNLKQIRNEKGIDQKELSKKCNMSVTYINKIETAGKSPSIDTLDKIAEALDVPTYKLLKP